MRPEQAAVIAQLSAFSSNLELEAAGLDFSHVVRTMLDEPGKPRKATKPVVKALAQAFQAQSPAHQPVACYPRALEMLAYAAVCAPLLDSDRLARVIHTTDRALLTYSPEHILSLTEPLAELLGPYSQQRREDLLKDLWFHAHLHVWWEESPLRALPKVEPTQASLGSISSTIIGLTHGLNAVETESWVRAAVRSMLDAALLEEGSDDLFVRSLQDLAHLEAGEEVTLPDDRRDVLKESFPTYLFGRILQPASMVAILGRHKALIEGVKVPSEGEEASSPPDRNSRSRILRMSSTLVSSAEFYDAYQQANLIDRVILSTSPHFPEEEAEPLAAALTAATLRVKEHFGKAYLERITSVLPSRSRWPRRPVPVVDLDPLREQALAGATPGTLVMTAKRISETHLSWDTPGDLAQDVFDEILGDGSAISRLGVICRNPGSRPGVLPPDVFRSLCSFGVLLAADAPMGSFLFSCLRSDVPLEMCTMTTLMMRILPIDDPSLALSVDIADPWLKSHAGYSTNLPLRSRPVSPIVDLVRKAEAAHQHARPTDAPFVPQRWADLAGRPDPSPFVYDERISSLDGELLPGLEDVRVTLLCSPVDLAQNAEHMGNCTNQQAYLGAARSGARAVLRFTVGGVDHNGSILRRGDTFYVGEINTRFNRGGVTPEVRAAFEELVAVLNA